MQSEHRLVHDHHALYQLDAFIDIRREFGNDFAEGIKEVNLIKLFSCIYDFNSLFSDWPKANSTWRERMIFSGNDFKLILVNTAF